MATDSYMPLPRPLGLGTSHLCQQPTVLLVDGGYSDITVRTGEGAVVVTCKRKHASLSSRKEFYDAEQRLLFTLRREHFSLPRSYYLASGPHDEHARENHKIVEFKGRFAFTSPKIDVLFTSTATSPPQPVKLEIRGKIFDRNADILWDAAPVARVRKEFPRLKQSLVNARSWCVEIMPYVDLMLMAVIVVAIDEQRRDKQRGAKIGIIAANS